ncbi:MAG: DUF4360 domain-containing protein [Oligoflexus sp.]
MRNFTWRLYLFSPFLLLPSGHLLANDAPAYDEIYIRELVANGSGCNLQNTKIHLAPDRKSFTILFAEYLAEIYPRSERRQARKACQVTVNLQVPYGYQYAVAKLEYRGLVSLDAGIEAHHESLYYFQGDQQNSQIKKLERGPLEQSFTYVHDIDLNATIWSPCGASRSLNVKNSIAVQKTSEALDDASGLIGTDSLDGKVQHIVSLHWRRCES